MYVIFNVYDAKAAAWLRPHFVRSVPEGLRVFQQAAMAPESFLSLSPGDFTLFQLGEFDEVTGKFDLLPVPESLGTALQAQAEGMKERGPLFKAIDEQAKRVASAASQAASPSAEAH